MREQPNKPSGNSTADAPGQPGGVNFERLFQAAPGSYLVLSPQLIIQAASDAYLRATMTQRPKVVGRHIFDVFPDNPKDPDATGVGNLRASLERVLASRRPDSMAVQKYDIRSGDDPGSFEERYWSPVNVPVVDEHQNLVHIIHRVDDVTAYIRLQESMRDGNTVNAELSARTRAMEAEILQRAQELQLVNRELRALHEQLEQRVAERTAALESSRSELQRESDARKSAASKLERIEEQLRQFQRLDAIGRLAGGIAHDFNNLLTVILGFEAIARSRLPSASPALLDLDQIRKAGQRAAQLTSQLLTFSRQQLSQVATIDLNKAVSEARQLLIRLVGENVDFRVRCEPNLGLIDANPSHIEQVIMNMVVNARDAMPSGGTLTIETANVEIDDQYAAEHLGAEPGSYSVLTVSDTGMGMDRETQSRIFEPFFTTKGIGKGTGLGLSTVFGIVKQCHGHIWVYSEVGRGTTFKVYLPHSKSAATSALTSPTRSTLARARHGEAILLVEDDDQVRMVGCSILRAAGFTVLEANGPEAALTIARDPQSAFDALVTDVVMPGMGGRVLAELVQAMRPDTAVLFTSGYSDDVILQNGVRAAQVAFVQKPLSASTLTRQLREVLDLRARPRSR